MFHWEQERRRVREEPTAQLGEMTLSGEIVGANLGGERRWLEVCAPGGLRWRPREGEKVLVLKLPEEGAACVLGTMEPEKDLRPGQMKLTGGNCTLFLGNSLELTGEVRINGETLEELIRRVAADEKGD